MCVAWCRCRCRCRLSTRPSYVCSWTVGLQYLDAFNIFRLNIIDAFVLCLYGKTCNLTTCAITCKGNPGASLIYMSPIFQAADGKGTSKETKKRTKANDAAKQALMSKLKVRYTSPPVSAPPGHPFLALCTRFFCNTWSVSLPHV